MNFVEMSSEEWEEIYRHHDALIHMGELELRSEEFHETPRLPEPAPHAMKPIEQQLRELDDVVIRMQH